MDAFRIRLSRIPQRVRGGLAAPSLVWRAALLGMVLTLSSLFAGFVLDDHMQRARVEERESAFGRTTSLDLYNFVTDGNRAALIESGALPWWTDPEVQLRFWRPVSAVTHWFDYTVFAGRAGPMHAHSILWFGAAVVCVAVLYRRLLSPPWVAGLAGLLFAVDEAHGFAVGFLANRNAFIAMVAAVGVLLLHQRWRTDGWRPGAWLAPSVLLVGLLSAEFSLFVTGYLFAYALFLDRGHSLVRRLATLVPYGVVVVGWRLAYKALGYGASASAAYIDPLDDFGRFADALLSRGPVLLLSQWTPLSSDPWIDRPDDQLVAFAPRALLGLAVIAAVVGPLLWRDRVARFFGVGMLLACVPVTATLPNDRLLLGIGIGAMGLVAQVIGRCWPGAVDGIRPVVGVWRRVPVKVLGVFFVVSHLVLAPLLLPLRAFMPGLVGNLEVHSYESLARSRTVADRQVVLFNSLGWISYSVLAMMAYHGDDPPICIRQLSTTGDPLRVTRLDDRTLRLETHWSLVDLLMSRLMRPAMPLREGETIELPELTVTVERVSGSRPVSVRYQYRHSLDDDRFLWLTWREDDFRDVALPAEGESVELPGVSVARALLDPFRAAP